MKDNLDYTISFIGKLNYKAYDLLYTASIAKEVVSGKEGNSGGIVIIGMLVVIVGLVGFIITKNKN